MQDEYDDLELEDAVEDEGYLDPMDQPGYGSVGPTKAAAAAGDINYVDNPGLQQYEQRQINAVQALRDARARAVEALKPKDDKSRYLALAAGFLAPTRTGGFGESVSNALQNYLPYQQQHRQDELGYQAGLSKYDMDIAQAEYESAMKPPVFTDIYKDGKKQKVAIINGRPVPVGGTYEGAKGSMTLLDKVHQLQQMTPEQRALYERYAGPKAMQVGIDINENKAFGKKLGEWDAEMYGKIQQMGMDAPINIAKQQRLGSLLGQVTGGKFQGTINEFNKALKTLGFQPEMFGITDDTAITDVVNSMARGMALELRNPSGGAGMPGALSDSDRNFLMSMVPGVETDPDAVPLMINWNIKLQERNRDVANLARKYAKAHGGLVDDGFYDELDRWSSTHPLFTDADRKAIEDMGAGGEPPPTNTGATEDPAKILNDAGFEIKDGKIVKKNGQ